MSPSLRHLQIFRLFARVLNVTETARLLHVAQPSVSQALKELEGQLGVELIIRGKGPLRLSADAQTLLADIDSVLEHMQGLRDKAARLRGEHDSSISIATVHPLTASLLPSALRRLRNDAPRARIRIEAHSSRDVTRLVAERGADVGFTFLPVDHPDLVVRPLLRTEMVCVLPVSHPLASHKLLTPADLKDEVIITLGAQLRQEFDVRFAFDTADDDPRFITTNYSIVSADLAQQNVGVAITLPFVLSQFKTAGLTAIPFEPTISRTMVAIYRRKPNMPALTKTLLASVREQIRQFHQELAERGLRSSLTASRSGP